jgi:hypothetical protein
MLRPHSLSRSLAFPASGSGPSALHGKRSPARSRRRARVPGPPTPRMGGCRVESPKPTEGRIAMKRSLLAVLATVGLVLGLSGPASAASPAASCSGLNGSSLAGQPGAKAADVRDGMGEADDLGIPLGALISEFSRSHPGSVEACFE